MEPVLQGSLSLVGQSEKQGTLKSMDFSHRIANPSPAPVQEKLQRKGMQPLSRSTKAKDRESSVSTKVIRDTSQERQWQAAFHSFNTSSGCHRSHTLHSSDTGNGSHINHTLQQEIALVASLKACARKKDLKKGIRLHADILKRGLIERNIYVGSSLVSMYAKCGALPKAQEVFDELPLRDVVTWTALIAGYAEHGHGKEALNCFDQMRHAGLVPTAITFACVVKACGSIGAVDKGDKILAEIVKEGLLETSVVLGSALVDMYAKCGALSKAQEVFDELPMRNVVTWTTLIAGYAQQGHGEEALNCFEQMRREGLSPNAVTFACVINACGSIGAVEKGDELYVEVVREGLLEKRVVLGNALVDMYAKCGALSKAHQVFLELPLRNEVTWNALIAGYAQHGQGKEALTCFEQMRLEGPHPNAVTFLVVLNACCHSGLVDAGEEYFAIMSTQYGIIPTLEHCTCMVDLFGRAGHFDKALVMIKKMPSSHLLLWSALLSACQKYGNVKLGRLAFENAVQLDEKLAATYICMSNMYAAAGMQDKADKIDALRVENEAW